MVDNFKDNPQKGMFSQKRLKQFHWKNPQEKMVGLFLQTCWSNLWRGWRYQFTPLVSHHFTKLLWITGYHISVPDWIFCLLEHTSSQNQITCLLRTYCQKLVCCGTQRPGPITTIHVVSPWQQIIFIIPMTSCNRVSSCWLHLAVL